MLCTDQSTRETATANDSSIDTPAQQGASSDTPQPTPADDPFRELIGDARNYDGTTLEADGASDSDAPVAETGHTFEHTFDSDSGTYRYYCEPHRATGMKGVVEVVE